MVKKTLFFLSALFFFDQAIGQYPPPQPSWLPLHPMPSKPLFRSAREPLPANRWLLTFNPPGLIEGAVGMGIGYRLNQKIEIWSETSGLLGYGKVRPVNGFRQILQVKRFIGRNYFLAGEVRYKSLSYGDTTDFYNPVTHDTLYHFGYRPSSHFFGVAVQWGRRYFLSKDGRFQMELIVGFGLKDKIFDKIGVPGGFGYLDHKTDFGFVKEIIEYRGILPYFPCSLRIIYNLPFSRRFAGNQMIR